MNNEPVAWINLERWKDTSSYLEDCVADMKLESAGIVIPLYTHPVKELALTDEEMISIYEKDWSGIKCGLGRAVEQAILRKASEK